MKRHTAQYKHKGAFFWRKKQINPYFFAILLAVLVLQSGCFAHKKPRTYRVSKCLPPGLSSNGNEFTNLAGFQDPEKSEKSQKNPFAEKMMDPGPSFSEKGPGYAFAQSGNLKNSSGSSLPPSAKIPSYQLDQVPENWVAQRPGSFQLKRYGVVGDQGTVQVSLSALEGQAGGLLANVNRWRDQMGQGPIGPEALCPPLVNPVEGQPDAIWVCLTHQGRSMWVVIQESPSALGGLWSWFFKMEGPNQDLEGLKVPFFQWAFSLRLGIETSPAAT